MAIKTFTSGEVLTAADTNTYLANSGLVYISTTALSGSNITLPACFSSTYDNYPIILSNVSTSNTGVYISVQFVTAGTASVVNYEWGFSGIRSDGINYSDFTGALTSSGKIGIAPGFAGAVSNSSIEVYSPFLTTRSYLTFHSMSYPSPWVSVTGGVYHDNQASRDSLKFLISGGTFTGTVTVYGYRKA